jgi:hypothetical protein
MRDGQFVVSGLDAGVAGEGDGELGGISTTRGTSSSSSMTSTSSPTSIPAASRISRRRPRYVSPPYAERRARIGVPSR